MPPYAIYILGRLHTPWNTPFDQQYVVEYDPGENDSGPGGTTLRASPAIANAAQYPDPTSAWNERFRVDPDCNWRWDLKVNAPLGQLRLQIVDIASGTPTELPLISNVQLSVTFPSHVQIAWDTDQACIGAVDYGLTDAYGTNVPDTTTAVGASGGVVSIPGQQLQSGATYHYSISAQARSEPAWTDALEAHTLDATFVWAKTGLPLRSG
jgi:hypothetical protein